MEGWIKLHRQIQANSLWYEKPFDKARAWIDLLLLANYEDKKTTYKGEIIVCERGTVNLSVNLLAQRWGWSRHKVSDFLDVLEKDNMLEQKRTRRRNVITIVNYDFYQCDEKEKDNSRTSNRTNKGQVTDITKKDKKDKNIYKEIYKEKFDDEIKEIISYFNQQTKSHYGFTNKQINELINARLNEHFTVDDFKKVIDNKTADWLNNEKMRKYLKPSTLFRPSHFEEYLNEKGEGTRDEVPTTGWSAANHNFFE